MTLQSSLEAFEPKGTPETKEPYASLEIVWKSLKDWGFTIDEYSKIPYSANEYKAWLQGQMTEKSKGQEEFLKTMFDLKFPGSTANPRILIHFRVRRSE